MPTLEDRHTVSMSCLAPAGQCVELVGDFPDWEHPVRMVEVAPGDYQCSLSLGPGVYRYKFRLNHRLWFADPLASLTDASNPFNNAILVIGGIESPFLFAPDRRHVFLSERGRLVVQIEAFQDFDFPIDLLVNVPGRHWESARFAEVAHQREGRILRAELTRDLYASPDAHANIRFSVLQDQVFPLPVVTGAAFAERQEHPALGRRKAVPGADKETPLDALEDKASAPPPLLDEPPSWLSKAVIYNIFVDRWLRGANSPKPEGVSSRTAPSGPWTFYGGDLDGVSEHLDHLESMGINTVLLSSLRPSPSPIRRYATDLLQVDPALGGLDALKRLVRTAHDRRMKVVVEASVNHVSMKHPLFQRVLRDQDLSEYADWFDIRRFPVATSRPETYGHLEGHPECPSLDLSAMEPRRYAMRSFDELVKSGVDGVLLHGLNDGDLDFWRALRIRLRRLNPNLLIAGQATGDNVATFAGSAGVDAIFDIRHRENLAAFFGSETIDALTFCRRVAYDDVKLGPLPESFFLHGVDTLDTPRFLSAALLQDRLRLSLAWTFMRPGPICLSYGTELGAEFLDSSLGIQNVWREKPPVKSLPKEPGTTMALIGRLAALRRDLKPLSEGTYFSGAFGDRCLAIERCHGFQAIRAYFNAGKAAIRLPPEILTGDSRLLLDVNVMPGTPSDILPPRTARIFSAGL